MGDAWAPTYERSRGCEDWRYSCRLLTFMSIILSTYCRFVWRRAVPLLHLPNFVPRSPTARCPDRPIIKLPKTTLQWHYCYIEEGSMHIDVYEAIQLTVIVLFPILLLRNIFRSSNAGICWTINRMKLRAQNFSWAREARVGPEMRRKDFNKGLIRTSEKAVYLDKLSVITNA